MSQKSREAIEDVAARLRSLRSAVDTLAVLEIAHVRELTGHQTVDSRQSLILSFERLNTAICDMELTLATVAEATAEQVAATGVEVARASIDQGVLPGEAKAST